ncbi:FliA/WhiG family RNA polymerase sigma factor [Clostridium formicaceticum]|uniref:RNA polymerase sigma factor n=1 Tax=Clostridium formicaceticum TaxID=1497 RepID=A0AAC9RM39_9CLOT|nr:FliA/WhiG family RNA polymerase sigma factor [Clostridium formicaceticum]AOY77293.1 RNA polymerase subunit sigma [Clostridium formicaceticum]ARE87835.1 RNA polymerase sigma-D factor [Clostridium formicaceticum]
MEYHSLWQKYKTNNDLEAKNCLIEKYIELVKVIAGRLCTTYGSNIEYDDLVSYGIFGLLDAIEKFDINKQVKFQTYAQIRIKGAIIDQLRNLDWVPRSIRQKSKLVEEAYNKLENKLGRNATDVEVATELNLSLDELYSILQQINSFNIVSLEEKLYDGNITDCLRTHESSPEDLVCNNEMHHLLQYNIDRLPERERQVISLYYYSEVTYKEIGEVLGISESRVSQLHSKAISRLKSKIIQL